MELSAITTLLTQAENVKRNVPDAWKEYLRLEKELLLELGAVHQEARAQEARAKIRANAAANRHAPRVKFA